MTPCRRCIASVILLLFMTTLAWSQESKTGAEMKKSREELEIMKGIVKTTLTFAMQNTRGRSYGLPSLSAFYLSGQGAVFVIPASALPLWGDAITNILFKRVDRPAEAAEKAESSERNLRLELERARGELERVREGERKNQEKIEADRKKNLQSLQEVKARLLEAVANYGDSLSAVKPEEHINLVFMGEGSDPERAKTQVVSIRKSWIIDYRAGKLSMDDFKQKAIQYEQ